MTTELGSPPKQRRPPRPNYNKIHASPLPLDIHPLPPLIPHNPLSILHVAFVYLSHLIFPPSSHPARRIQAVYDAATNSVHVTDEKDVRMLWERGFFGKGSLSRSEPTWLERERKRLGLLGLDTSEEYTNLRREERRAMKMERARVELEGIEETRRREEAGLGQSGVQKEAGTTAQDAQRPQEGGGDREDMTRAEENLSPKVLATIDSEISKVDMPDTTTFHIKKETVVEAGGPMDSSIEVEQQEHLQLAPEEAFFLTYSLGALDIYDAASISIQTPLDLLTLFRSNCYFPPIQPHHLTPFDPFLLTYVTYHHFRSLGWVVRPGVKFAVDWLLYLRGPVFAHAEFAVIVLPSFRDEYWWEGGRAEETKTRQRKDWWWLHCAQRVQAQVRKGLVIAWVEVPAPDAVERVLTFGGGKETTGDARGKRSLGTGVGQEDGAIKALLKMYQVREMVFKRWIPNRNRD